MASMATRGLAAQPLGYGGTVGGSDPLPTGVTTANPTRRVAPSWMSGQERAYFNGNPDQNGDSNYNNGQAGIMGRLNAALADQRKRRLQGQPPADRSMQMMPTRTSDLFAPGSFGTELAGG